MSVAPRRVLRRLAVTGAAASVLVSGFAAEAQAASYPHISLAKAKAALPTSKSLPGHVKLEGKVRTANRTYGDICTTKPTKILMPGGSVVIADYSNGKTLASPDYLSYEVAVAVFATSAQATAAGAKLTKAEKVCPKSATDADGVVIKRTLSMKATSKAWTGYRTIDHVTATIGSTTVKIRGFETYLVRGNALVLIDQIGGETPANGKLQDVRRKAVTNLVIARLSAIK